MQLHPSITTADPPARSSTEGDAPQPGSPSPIRTRVLWAVSVVALILSLVFTPPLVNANRYQREIARSMSESLGRPVHLDNVTLHLLPVPGLTLSNLAVSEDPAFGDEPTIRANSVEATLRLSSLWRRRVEFSRVRFVEPSVNLVRNREGRWNLANVLLRASHVETAPTAQRRAGPAPRFPYIEATGSRVNIKLDNEKLPFSLTEADFALWLPSPNHWRVRLEGQPARTDTNLNDPGTFRLEGDLQRAGTAENVPINLTASWHNAPLGEASRMLTADDLGWRGLLNLDASLAGTLGTARLQGRVTLGGLRRAEFAASHPLDLQISCGSGLSVQTVSFQDLRCTLPDSAPEPMVLEVPTLDLQRPGLAHASLTAQDVPLHWGLLWAALFSARVPTELYPKGIAELHFEHLPVTALTQTPKAARRGQRVPAATVRAPGQPPSGWSAWDGEVVLHLPPAPTLGTAAEPPPASVEIAKPVDLHWITVPPETKPTGPGAAASPAADFPGAIAFHLRPVSIPVGPGISVTVTGGLNAVGYTVAVSGTGSVTALLLPARYLPQLGDGLDDVLSLPLTASQPARVDFTCTHPWGAVQTCTTAHPTTSVGRPAPVGMTAPAQSSQTPALLSPRSLSPFDHSSRLGGPPPQQP